MGQSAQRRFYPRERHQWRETGGLTRSDEILYVVYFDDQISRNTTNQRLFRYTVHARRDLSHPVVFGSSHGCGRVAGVRL